MHARTSAGSVRLLGLLVGGGLALVLDGAAGRQHLSLGELLPVLLVLVVLDAVAVDGGRHPAPAPWAGPESRTPHSGCGVTSAASVGAPDVRPRREGQG
ncbi:hypothetical protein [Streptomyces canus]|uniref:hypothetical protein n=1 Tax=Streptomyces canus TaxID=58343 RepID=UPI002E37A48A|nr:hypothetical protein [Streptomyces canus]